MRATVLGILKGKSKSGKDFMQIYASKEFSAYEQQNNICEGVSVFSEFTYNGFAVKTGDVADFIYEPGFQGRAALVDVVPVRMADKAGK